MRNLLKSFLFKSIIAGFILRLIYLFNKTGDISKINLGGDPCHHFNLAYNISKFNGPKTDFIFSYWHRHDVLPAITDVYPPGFHFFSAIFIFFYDDFIITRIIPIIIFILNIYLTILISKKIQRSDLGIMTCFLILINYFHIENSVVFMTVTFYMLIIQIYFYLLIFYDQNRKYIYLLGLSVGYASITFGGWQILFLITFIFLLINKIKSIKDYSLFFIGFLTIALPWGFYTYSYFGSPYYSNLNFYPIIDSWSEMLFTSEKPTINYFLANTDFSLYFKNHLIWSIENLKKFCLILFPTFLFPISFLLIPMLIHGSIKLKKYGFYILLFVILYFIVLSISGYAFSGKLSPRHFLPLLFLVSLLMSSSILEIYKFLSKYKFFINIYKFQNFFLIFAFSVTVYGVLYKENFWNKNTKPFYEFGRKVQKIVKINEKIMYGSTPQDLWCVARRQIILDPNNMFNIRDDKKFYQFLKKRVIKEINYYKPEYLLLDFSKHIYDRSNNYLSSAINYYSMYDLSLKLSDEVNEFYLYKVNY